MEEKMESILDSLKDERDKLIEPIDDLDREISKLVHKKKELENEVKDKKSGLDEEIEAIEIFYLILLMEKSNNIVVLSDDACCNDIFWCNILEGRSDKIPKEFIDAFKSKIDFKPCKMIIEYRSEYYANRDSDRTFEFKHFEMEPGNIKYETDWITEEMFNKILEYYKDNEYLKSVNEIYDILKVPVSAYYFFLK